MAWIFYSVGHQLPCILGLWPLGVVLVFELLSGFLAIECPIDRDAISVGSPVPGASAALRNYALSFVKIANDIRWLGSGPRCGIGELQLPATQPGSSIMPGKVNPVIAESLLMVCAQVIGHDSAIAWCAAAGNFELNVMMPLMAWNLLDSIELLAAGTRNFETRLLRGLEANRERAAAFVEQSLAMATVLLLEHVWEQFLRQGTKQIADRGQFRVVVAVAAHNLLEHRLQTRRLAANVAVVAADDVADQLLGGGSGPFRSLHRRALLNLRQQIERAFHGHACALTRIFQSSFAATAIVDPERLENPDSRGMFERNFSHSLVQIPFHAACLRIQNRRARWRKQ